MRQEIGQMREINIYQKLYIWEIAYDLHLNYLFEETKIPPHQEFLDFMNDNIDDSNQAPSPSIDI